MAKYQIVEYIVIFPGNEIKRHTSEVPSHLNTRRCNLNSMLTSFGVRNVDKHYGCVQVKYKMMTNVLWEKDSNIKVVTCFANLNKLCNKHPVFLGAVAPMRVILMK